MGSVANLHELSTTICGMILHGPRSSERNCQKTTLMWVKMSQTLIMNHSQMVGIHIYIYTLFYTHYKTSSTRTASPHCHSPPRSAVHGLMDHQVLSSSNSTCQAWLSPKLSGSWRRMRENWKLSLWKDKRLKIY